MRADRINTLINIVGAKRYLEVGVSHGETFHAVNIAFKVAVDPFFAFDYKSLQSDSVHYHPKRSDDFFRTAEYSPFDIIYLDGLHTFEQTLRDFLWSLSFAHKRTVWVIDDTVPNDAYSALPDQARCYRLREKTGNDDRSWMGDVFKVVDFISEFMPQFEFRTFDGHGQAVVWQQNRTNFVSGQRTVESIARSDFMDFSDSVFPKMRCVPDSEIYAAVTDWHSKF